MSYHEPAFVSTPAWHQLWLFALLQAKAGGPERIRTFDPALIKRML